MWVGADAIQALHYSHEAKELELEGRAAAESSLPPAPTI
jgi:hypothetical protein